MRRIALIGAGVAAALAVAGGTAFFGYSGPAGVAAGGATAASARSCTSSAYQAIRTHVVLARPPAACEGLGSAQVSHAASLAIRIAAGSGPKSVWRRRSAAAAPYVTALLTNPVPASPTGGGGGYVAAGVSGGSRLGGVSELAVQLAALLAWLATALSGGYVLLKWLRAGGSLRRRSATSAPPAVIAGHPGFGLLGLVLWVVFMLTGWVPLAWITVGLLGPVAGLGMGLLLLGLPSPRAHASDAPQAPDVPHAVTAPNAVTAPGALQLLERAPAVVARPVRHAPVFVIVAHALFALTVLLLVITATIGAG